VLCAVKFAGIRRLETGKKRGLAVGVHAATIMPGVQLVGMKHDLLIHLQALRCEQIVQFAEKDLSVLTKVTARIEVF
jgi:hypothetical protein